MRILPFIRMAALAAAAAGFAGAAAAQDMSILEETAEASSVAPAAPVVPWYQQFTQDADRYDLTGAPLDRSGPTLEFDVGGNIGLSLGFERGVSLDQRLDNVDGVNAGAFFKVSPRIRVGGELGYRAESGSSATLQPSDRSGASQIKLESAFRF